MGWPPSPGEWLMNVNRLTEKAREAVLEAQTLAEQENHNEIASEHLLATLLDQQGGVVPELLRKLQLDPRELRNAVEAELQRRPKVYGGAQAALSQELSRVVNAADQEAKRLKDDYISTEHLLLSLVEARDS